MIDEIVTRLQAETSSFIKIEHAYSMAPVDDLRAETPAIYIYPGEEKAGASEYDSATVQKHIKQAVLFIVGPTANIEALKAEVRGALLGWQPDQYHAAMELVGGKPSEIQGGYIWWQEAYQSDTQIRG